MTVVSDSGPRVLPRSTTERLLAVADILEAAPERWEQDFWFVEERDSDRSTWSSGEMSVDAFPAVTDAHGRGVCGSYACIAGHAVMQTPLDVPLPGSWSEAGRVAFGLERDLGHAIFVDTYAPADVVGVLRLIAAIPEGQRCLRAAIDAGLRDLAGADLSSADLTDVDLSHADLTGVDLSHTNLSGADLSGANLAGSFMPEPTPTQEESPT